MWIESHQSIQRHPKTRRLAKLLGVGVPQAIGHLHCLWWWCLDYAQDGDLTDWEIVEIAQAAMWDGEPDALVDALLTCGNSNGAGYLERVGDRLLVHDWYDYAGRLVERRRADAERKREERTEKQSAGRDSAAVAAVRSAYDSAGVMLSKGHIDAHLDCIEKYGITAWQAGWEEAKSRGRHNVVNYVIRCVESAVLQQKNGNGNGHGNGAKGNGGFGLRRGNESIARDPAEEDIREFAA